MKDKIILAIETSCDETSIAIVKNKKEILAHVINSQADKFKEIGGVVPEMASRMHVDNIFPVYIQALKEANITIDEIDAIAVTYGPGLVGALLCGVNFANSLSMLTNKPLIAVNHMQGHIQALNINDEIVYPALALIVSGGHTELVYMPKAKEYQIIGQTLDDAAGESYDKVARILKLGYPGGPLIDQLAKTGIDNYDLPYPKNDESYDFSFSGLKSACFNLVNQQQMKNIEIRKADFACSFQNRVVEVLLNKLSRANDELNPATVGIVGGVSANSELKKRAKAMLPEIKIPQLIYSTDNAAMIAMAAFDELEDGNFVDSVANAKPTISVEDKWQN